MAVREAPLISYHALMVNHEEAIPVDARYSYVPWLREAEGIVLSVVPLSIRVEVVQIVLERNVTRGMPGKEDMRPRLRRADMGIADVVADRPRPLIDRESGRRNDPVQRIRGEGHWHKGGPEVIGRLILHVVHRELQCQRGCDPPGHRSGRFVRVPARMRDVPIARRSTHVRPVCEVITGMRAAPGT